MADHNTPNKITVKTTGAFELRDPVANIDITENPQEVLETSFVSQMLGLKRLELVSGDVTQESSPTNQGARLGGEHPLPDPETSIQELNEQAERKSRGRPANTHKG